MSAFKELVASDLDIFINNDEFAEHHDLNGTVCKAVLQDISTVENLSDGASRRTAPHFELYGSTVIVHCKTADLPEIPVYGQTFTVDGKLYLVDEVTEAMGMLTMTLEANDR